MDLDGWDFFQNIQELMEYVEREAQIRAREILGKRGI